MIFYIKRNKKKIINYFVWRLVALACQFPSISKQLLFFCSFFEKQYHHSKVLPIVWMDLSISEKWLLRGSENNLSCNPVYNGTQEIFGITLPNIYCRFFKNSSVSMSSSSVVLEDESVCIERVLVSDIDKNFFDYSAGHIISHTKTVAIVKMEKANKEYENGIFLGGNGCFNYYHWMIEILPKLQFLEKIPGFFSNYPLLISDDVEKISNFREVLNLLKVDKEIIFLPKNELFFIKNIVYFDTQNNIPFNLRDGYHYKKYYTLLSKNSIFYMRNSILKGLHDYPGIQKLPKRVFFSRKNERRKYNKEDVLSCLIKYGFSEVFMEDMSFIDQVYIMLNAEYIAGPTGAVWTNIIFSEPGTKGLCWMAQEFSEFSAFSTLAYFVDVDLRYIFYNAETYSTAELFSKEYTIDVNKIEATIKMLVSSNGKIDS